MTTSADRLRGAVAAYLDLYPGERGRFSELLAAIEPEVTCAAVLIDRHRRALPVPGTRLEATDETLMAPALRAIRETTGLRADALALTPVFRDTPIDITLHADGRRADVCFVLSLTSDEDGTADWRPFDKIPSSALRAKLEKSGLDGAVVPLNVSAVIHDGRGAYLLHLRDANKPWIWGEGQWSLLGGGREPQDTTLLDTMRRELWEEAGLVIPDLEPFAVEHAIGIDGTRVPVQHYAGRWEGDPAALPLSEGVMLAWIRPEKFPFMTMLPSTADLLRRHAATHAAASPAPTPASRGVPHVVGVHLLLERDGEVLLGLRRPDSAYAGATWHFLAGHCEQESATACLVREAYEEAGLVIDPAELDLVHTVHVVDRPGGRPRLQLVFRARRWEGTPRLREPDKCVAWRWWDLKKLPDPIVPYTRAAIQGVLAGRSYTELGWSR
ncbi:NUDIX domain-containing protein [Streptomyces sp. NPDC053493]|uniref:NUDIX hydrolase n=1 Tax=Streptomyces sp. NPDC053493 TaxID=3365705 RepID=UPI0037CEF4B2